MPARCDNLYVGCMSGTSADGVDAAAILTDGRDVFGFGDCRYRPYSNAESLAIKGAFGCWQGNARVAEVEAIVESAHADVLADFGPMAAIGFHGQTLAHDPEAGRTHQAGDGGRLASMTGHTVVWDFRSDDILHGGQGAPLAPFFHFALARHLRMDRPVAFLNLGGVANVSIVDPGLESPEQDGAAVALDTGPANAVIDDLVWSRTGRVCDEGGRLAGAGTADEGIVEEFLQDGWFDLPPPKSLDRNRFAAAVRMLETKSLEDAAATATAMVVAATARSLDLVGIDFQTLAVCGGGRHNQAVMAGLANRLSADVVPVEKFGLDGDMLEAQAFAYLAARVIKGLPTTSSGTTGCKRPVCGGRISGPDDLLNRPSAGP